MTTETQLPQGWEIKRLGDVATSEKGKKPKNQSNEKTDEFCYPYVDIEAFEKGVIKSYTDGVKCVLCDENDFLMVWDGSRSGLVGKGIKGALGSTLVRISLPNVKNLYAYYFLLSKYKEINTRAKGSGTPHVDPDLLWNYAFPIPSLEETQTAIVNKIESLFAEIDAGIASLKTAQQQLKHYRQSLLKNAFNGELTKQWRLEHADRLPSATELLAQIQTAREQHHAQQLADWQTAVKQWEQTGKQGKKPSKPKKLREFIQLTEEYLPNLPKEWCWVELSSISSAIRIGPFGSLLHKADYINNGIPLINPSHIKNRKIIPDFQLTVSEEKLKELNNYIMRENDIVIGRRGEMGRCAVVTSNENGWLCGTGSMFVRPLNSMSSEFFAYIISSERVRDYLSNSSIGTTMQNLNEKILHTVPVPLCSPQEQLEILRILDACFTACDQLTTEIETQLKQAELLKQAVLKSAFSGNLLDK